MSSKFAREEEYNYNSCDSADESECDDVPEEDVEDYDTSRRGGPCSVQGQGRCSGCGESRQLYISTGKWTCQKTHELCCDCNGESYCPVDRGHPRSNRATNDGSSWCTIF